MQIQNIHRGRESGILVSLISEMTKVKFHGRVLVDPHGYDGASW